MTKSLSLIKCYFHPNQKIIKFCINSQCTLPLCQKCLPIHQKQHIQQQNTVPKAQIILYDTALKNASDQFQTTLFKRKQQKNIVNNKLQQLRALIVEEINKSFVKVEKDLKFQQLQELEQKLNKIKRGSVKNLIYYYAGDYHNLFNANFQQDFEDKIMRSMIEFFTNIKNFISEIQTTKNLKYVKKNPQRLKQQQVQYVNTNQNLIAKVSRINKLCQIKETNCKQKLKYQRYNSESTQKLRTKNNIKIKRCLENGQSLLDLRQNISAKDLNCQQFTFKRTVQNKKFDKDFGLQNFNVQLAKPNQMFCFSSNYQNKQILTNHKNIQNIRSKYSSVTSNSRKHLKFNQQMRQINKNKIMSNQQIRESIQKRLQKRHLLTQASPKNNSHHYNFSSIKRQTSIEHQVLNQSKSLYQKKKKGQPLNKLNGTQQNLNQSPIINNQKLKDQNIVSNSRFKRYNYLEQLSSNLQNSNILRTSDFKE